MDQHLRGLNRCHYSDPGGTRVSSEQQDRRHQRRDNRDGRRPLTHGSTKNNFDYDKRRQRRLNSVSLEDVPIDYHHYLYHNQQSERYIFELGGRSFGISTIFRLVIISGIMAVATINFTVSSPPLATEPKTIASFTKVDFKSAQIDEDAEHFFRTGKLKTKSRGTIGEGFNDPIPENSAKEDKYKRNKILYGSKSKGRVDEWPLLSELIDSSGNIATNKNISGFLDFSIIGFPKTGTTSLLRHLADVTHSLPAEHCGLVANNTATLLKDIYDDRAKRLEKIGGQNGKLLEEQLRGLKCPQDVSSDWSMHNYAKYFPRTKLIVGIRHPVLWFQSLYNFRVSNVPWKRMLHTSELTKGCIGGSQGVCAWRANFHDFLSRLGKTPMTAPAEKELLQLGLDRVQTPVGPVFLYELSQLVESDDGGIRSGQFRKDLSTFLGLDSEIPPFPKVDTSGRFDSVPGIKQMTEENKINICDEEHARIREVLMEKARMASMWIRQYFLQSTEVFVSSKQHLIEILETWMHDPCIKKG